jgi:polysaccharide export outer membrane protein
VLSALVAGAALAPSGAWAKTDFAQTLPPPDPANGLAPQDYRIGPLDELDMVVFQEKDLTLTVDVDASGRIVLPLVGSVIAAGKTPDALANEIAAKLGEKYLQDPQVAIVVKKPVSQKITVEGEVTKPGVYAISGRTTLIKAVALASGADQYANFRRVAVFRYVGDKRYAALFNLDKINKGEATDPEVYNNDIVVVEKSGAKSAIRDYVGPLAPLIYTIPVIVPKF